MKRIDFDNGNVAGNILNAAIPMLVAQILSLLYNIVDRIYIARIPDVGTAALGAVGLCFPIITIVTACSNLLLLFFPLVVVWVTLRRLTVL